MTTEAKHRLAVILHADVVESTALVRKDERVAHERIQAAFHSAAQDIEARGGVVNELRGDALVAEFSRASDALLAALSAQQRNTSANAALGDEIAPVLRIGIALGEVVVADDTVTGAGVVLAQRLEQLATPGGICISGAVREAVPDRLRLDYASLGEQTVKGFDEPVRALTVTLREGEHIPQPEPHGPVGTRGAGAGHRRTIGAFAVVLLAAGGVALWWMQGERPSSKSTQQAIAPDAGTTAAPAAKASAPAAPSAAAADAGTRRSIAVLPFTNMSNDPDQEYFSDGLTEDIITDLARISGLFVIARNSTFVYKGRAVDVKTIGSELGVRYVVEGSVRKAAGRVRISAQLIDVESGMHVWADRYDRDLTDVFALQDEVTRTIVDSLSVNLSAEEADVLTSEQKVGTDAYDLLLRGNEIMARFSPQAMVEAREIYRQVIQLNPRYARAHANIAFAYAQEALFGWTDDIERTLREGFAAAEEARRLDDRIPQLHLALASLHGAELRWEDADRAAQHTVKLEPSYADGFAMRTVALTFLGDLDAAASAIDSAKQLNPHHSFIYLWLEGRVDYLRRRYDQAVVLLEEAARRNPNFDQIRIMLAATYAQLGRNEDAHWEAEELLTMRPDFTIAGDLRVRGFRDPAMLEHYADGLRKAGLPE